jgi:hypothetical protein
VHHPSEGPPDIVKSKEQQRDEDQDEDFWNVKGTVIDTLRHIGKMNVEGKKDNKPEKDWVSEDSDEITKI